jgi:hypothetical protein
MVRKIVSGMVAGMLVAAAAAACAGPTGAKSEGDGCGANDDCGDGLVCQPVTGHTGDYCCPSPLVLPGGAIVSSQSNCRPSTTTN